MDGKLAEMMARRRKQEQDAEEEEWKPSSIPARVLPPTPSGTPEPAAQRSSSQRPSQPQAELGSLQNGEDLIDMLKLHNDSAASGMASPPDEPRSSESHESNAEAVMREIEELNASMEKEGFANHILQPEDVETVAGISPNAHSARPAANVPSSPLESVVSRTSSTGSHEAPAQEGPIKRILKPTGSFKGAKTARSPQHTPEDGGSSPLNSKGGLKWRDTRLASEIDINAVPTRAPKWSPEDHSTVAYRMTATQDVPVLVIPTGDNWRAGAQASSTAFNTLQNQLGINLRENPKEVPDANAVLRVGGGAAGKQSTDTMAKAKSRVMNSVGGNERNLGTNSLFPKKDGDAIFHRASSDNEHQEETRVSVPASSRSNLLDNNAPPASQVLALSTGTLEERAQAARRICRRAKTAREVSELVDAGVIGSIGPLLSDPRGVDAAIEALLRLCSAIKDGKNLTSPDTQHRMELELIASLEDNGVAERLAALICWSRDEPLKGRMALLIFHMAQNHKLANRVIVQDGAIAALVHLLDSPVESASASAAAALANISYWSTEPAPRLSHFKILCAL